MEQMLQALCRELTVLELPLAPDTQKRLCAFGQAVVQQNAFMNLTAITEPEQVARLHLADSLTPLKLLPLAGKRVIDIGCGAGFPGVPLKIACPALELTLLDSLGKRMSWLAQVLPTLGVQAECVTARAEEAVSIRREQYDVAVSRAVARLNILLELTAPYVKVGGCVLAMKGSSAPEELAEAQRAMRVLGLKQQALETFHLGEAVHTVIVLRKTAPTPPQYPRRYAKIKQTPL